MIKPIQIPSLPFASSILGGEQHAGIRPVNDLVFNTKYFASLYEIHKNDTPLLLSQGLAKELIHYSDAAHKDLALIMFERMRTLEVQGTVIVPMSDFIEKDMYVTLVYDFNKVRDSFRVVISIMERKKNEEAVDCPFFAFYADATPEKHGIEITSEVDIEVPIMFLHGKSISDLEAVAMRWTMIICILEAMFAYQCVRYKSITYSAMLEVDGVSLNPNFVQVNILTLESEESPSV